MFAFACPQEEHRMQTAELETFKHCLVDMRTRLTDEVNRLEEAAREDVMPPGEISTVRLHNGDMASEASDDNISLSQHEEEILEQVEAALGRIEDGTYGACQNCGREIEHERLDAIPYTPYCAACAQQIDSGKEVPHESPL
jgi:RNA polymerase-binding protein DksA